MSRSIEDLLHRRTDLSTFLVHLTRTDHNGQARDRLFSILMNGMLQLGRPMGMAAGPAVERQEAQPEFYMSQQVICFTETPLEHAWMMCEDIANRQVQFEPYGIAVTRTWGRQHRLNPVWYLDITPGHDWLTQPVNRMIEEALAVGQFEADVFRITPYIEQMGPTASARKEFWWEREWRLAGRELLFTPIDLVAVLVPAEDHVTFRAALEGLRQQAGIAPEWFANARLIDPRWGLERIIASLASVPEAMAGPFPV